MQAQVGIYSKGSSTIERGDKLSFFEFLNEASFYEYLLALELEAREKNNK